MSKSHWKSRRYAALADFSAGLLTAAGGASYHSPTAGSPCVWHRSFQEPVRLGCGPTGRGSDLPPGYVESAVPPSSVVKTRRRGVARYGVSSGQALGQKPYEDRSCQRPVFGPFSSGAPAWPQSILFGQARLILYIMRPQASRTGPECRDSSRASTPTDFA